MEEKNEPLASEMYKDLQKHDKFKGKVIAWLVAALIISVFGNIIQSVYHDWKWSQFDTVVVDSGDGGNANYVGGENTGGIYNGEGGSEEAQEGQIQGNAD